MNKLITFLFLGIILISFVNAQQQSLGTFKQYDCVNLKQSCSSCSYINFTEVIYPDSTTALGNVEATQTGTVFNYTFCDTNQLGSYIVYGVGDVDGTDTVFAYDFNITTTGAGGMTFLIILLLIFAFAFLIFSIVVQEELFVYISGVCFLVAGVVLMIYGIDTLNDWTTRAIAFVCIGLGMIFSIGAYIYNGYSGSDYAEEF